MYPFRAVIVGGSETERTAIRREVTNLSVVVEREFDDIDKVIGQRPLLADSKCFFLVKVNSSANMDQMARLNQSFMGKPIVALLNEDSDLSAIVQIQRAVRRNRYDSAPLRATPSKPWTRSCVSSAVQPRVPK